MPQRVKKAVKAVAAKSPDTGRTPTSPAQGAVASRAKTSSRPEAATLAGEIERERDELRVALATAQARVRALEAAQSQVANRIGWMIEALQTLKDEGR